MVHGQNKGTSQSYMLHAHNYGASQRCYKAHGHKDVIWYTVTIKGRRIDVVWYKVILFRGRHKDDIWYMYTYSAGLIHFYCVVF